jgi:hypothetical protein
MRLLELLMKHGADIHRPDAIGRTAHDMLQAHTTAITPAHPPRYPSTPPPHSLALFKPMTRPSLSPAGLAFAGQITTARGALPNPIPSSRNKKEWQPRWAGGRLGGGSAAALSPGQIGGAGPKPACSSRQVAGVLNF